MTKQFLNPPGLAPTHGWAQLVTSTGGKTVYVSGQVSVDGMYKLTYSVESSAARK